MSFILIFCLFGIALMGIRYLSVGKPIFGILIFLISCISIFFVIFPDKTTPIAHFLGVGRGADLLIYTLFIINLFLIIFNNIRFERYNRKLTQLVRSQAILNSKKDR